MYKNKKIFIIQIISLAFVIFLIVLSINNSKTPNKPINNTFPIKIIPVTKNNVYTQIQGNIAPCQPDSFDPKINKFYKNTQSGVPSELYAVEGFSEYGLMMIDGWNKEGEHKVNLPFPFNITDYTFGCASSFSHVLDLSKNNIRQALYTHVLHYSFSNDGRYLFLVNNINNQGNWTLHRQIINIETNELVELPKIECLSQIGFWQGDRLITFTEVTNKPDYTTDVCIWDKSAKLISRLGTNTYWGAASTSFLAEQIGLLPNDLNTFYAFTTTDDHNSCALFLMDVIESSSNKTIIIRDRHPDEIGYNCSMPKVEFDFSNASLTKGTLKYRIENETGFSDKNTWNKWQEINI